MKKIISEVITGKTIARKVVNRKTKHKRNNLITISDIHAGCQLALCPPQGVMLDNGGIYMPSLLQLKIYAFWREFWDEWVPVVTRGEDFDVCINGDTVDGVHHGSTTQISHNPEDQARIAMTLIAPEVAKAERFYFNRGTSAHVGESGVQEEMLAQRLGAVPNKEGQHARHELWLRVGTGLVHLMHHIGTTGSAAYEATAVHKEMTESYVEAARNRDEPPDVIVRSHRHRAFTTSFAGAKGEVQSTVTPGWQAKMLDLNTPLPTPTGWTTMGDVKVGDILFDEQGKKCTVLTVSDINLRPKSYIVKFSNGEEVKACSEHLWFTTASVDKPGVPGSQYDKRPLARVRTTQEIKDTLVYGKDKDNNHRISMPGPLDLPDAHLEINPYILGAWLGDGDSDCARITIGAKDIQHFVDEFKTSGYSISQQKQYKDHCLQYCIRATKENNDGSREDVSKNDGLNLQRILRKLNLLNNKHIPQKYLRASFSQRLALLQGLMDTDGAVDPRGTTCSIVTVSDTLKDGMAELLATLGLKFRATKISTKCNGVVSNPVWSIKFFSSPDIISVFRMKRKLERLPLASSRKTAPKSRSIMITDVIDCEPVPMRCIAIDSPTHLYRFGKTMLPTHNTPFAFRIAGARLSVPQFGGLIVRAGDEDPIYVRHKTFLMKRAEVE